MSAEVARREIPGLTFAVTTARRLERVGGQGYADLAFSVPVTPDTLFSAASITKAITAVGIAQLVEAEMLAFDDPITSRIPELPESWDRVTIRRLLTHTAGIPDVMADAFTVQTIADTPEEAITALAARPLPARPGDVYSYNQAGYLLLGHVIERITGLSFPEYCTERLFAPLGLGRPPFGYAELPIRGRATAYTRWRWLPTGVEQLDHLELLLGRGPAMLYPAGGINLSAPDLARWVAGLFQGRLIRRDTLESLWEPAVLSDGTVYAQAPGLPWIHAGLGWGVGSGYDPVRRVVGFSGNLSTAFLLYPDDDLAVVVFTNVQGSEPEAIAAGIADRILVSR